MRERILETTKRSLHPWRDRLEHLPEGKGNFYYWGPNYTVDPIVITNETVPKILLIRRHDNGMWALPGGFIDKDEDPATAGRRELREETELTVGDAEPRIVYAGPVNDHRATLHAWPETVAMMWIVDEPGNTNAGDDATAAEWVPLDSLPTDLHGSHRELIELALRLQSPAEL